MYILHFHQSIEVNACVKQLQASIHDGFLWLDKKNYMDVELIETITRLPLEGIDPMLFFKKYQDTMLTNKKKCKYNVFRDKRGFLIISINDHIVQFTSKVLATELVRQMQPNQCTTSTIAMTKICAELIQMNWSHYLLNKLLEYVKEFQGKGIAFHYSWFLILISFVTWSELANYQGVDIPV